MRDLLQDPKDVNARDSTCNTQKTKVGNTGLFPDERSNILGQFSSRFHTL
jgi:hypothetical protein